MLIKKGKSNYSNEAQYKESGFMDTKLENKEINETAPKESTEKISAQGMASMQGVESKETAPQSEKVEAAKPPVDTPDPKRDTPSTPTVPPPADSNPPSGFQPQRSDGTELGTARIKEGRVEKPEKEVFTHGEGENGKPGSLNYRPGGVERG
jgi:hypothetical protein